MIPSDWIQIRYLSRNLLYLSLSRPHSEFTSGRCFHIQRGPCPSGSGVSTRVISALRSGCQGKKTESASAPREAQGTQMKAIWTPCVYVGAGCGHICVVMRACIFARVYVQACTHRGRAAVPVCLLTDSLLVNEQLSAITIHEPCHSPPLSKHQHLKPWNPLVSH